MVPIVEVYTYEYQPANPAKNPIYIFSTNRKPGFSSYTKIGKLPKMTFGKIKADTPEPHPHVIHEVEK